MVASPAGNGKNEDEVIGEVLSTAREKGIRFIALRFIDLAGTEKNCEIPVERLEAALTQNLWFDGSSIDGFTRIHESDTMLKPDAGTFTILPWAPDTAAIVCDVCTPDGRPFEGDPRTILRKALAKAAREGLDYQVGPELEFFLFKDRNGDATAKPEPEPHDTAGYFDAGPTDLAIQLRREIVPALQAMGIEVEMAHHEVAPGQHEIDFKYGSALAIADKVIFYKHAVRTLARKHGLYASFMPKPVYGINGSGMHVHQSLWKDGKNAFAGDEEYGISAVAKGFIAGQLEHARALSSIVAPTVNSYKRLVLGYEAPVYVCWGRVNRSALIRVPAAKMGSTAAVRAELRCPDPSCNPYLALAAMLEAGMDGVRKKAKPPAPVDEDVYEFDDEKLTKLYIKTLPSSLEEAMREAKADPVIKEALGLHAFESLQRIQKKQWDDYRKQVTEWELKTYLATI